MNPPNALDFRLLGPMEVRLGADPINLGAPKQRAVLALLLLSRGAALSSDRLIDALWGEHPPRAAAKSVQVYVSGLRKVLPEGTLETRGHGYALNRDGATVDAERFEDLLEAGRRKLEEGDAATAAKTIREGLALWRGAALSDFTYEGFAQEEIARLEELRLSALEERFEAELAMGRHSDLVPELTRLVAEHPLRERMRGQLMLALYRSGRQTEALEVYRTGRRALLDEQGLEPGPALRELEAAILRQDPELDAPARVTPRMVHERRRRGGLLLAAGGVVLLLAAVAAGIAALGGEERISDEPLADGLAQVADSGAVSSFTETGAPPGNVAVGEGSVWMLGGGKVSRVDPKTHEVVKTFDVGGVPAEIAVGEGAVWVGLVGGEGDTNSVVRVARVDPKTQRVTATARLPGAGAGVLPTAGLPRVAAGAGAAWAINPDGSVSRIDARTGQRVARVKPEVPAWGIAAGDAGVWFLSLDEASKITRIDQRTNSVGQSIELQSSLLWGIAVGGGSVWATAREEGLLWRIKPGRDPVSRSIDVGTGVTTVAYGGGAVWTGNYIDGTVSRVDARSNKVTARTPVDAPQSLAVGAGSAWVGVAGRANKGALPASVCGEVASGGAKPDVLIASDLPLRGPGSDSPRAMAAAVRYVLDQHRYRAGRYTVGYQSCDVSTVETGGFEFRRCAANANSYAHSEQLVAIVGTYSSFCAEIELPIVNRARPGPVPMVSPSNTGQNLTRGPPLAYAPDQPGIFYPTGVRHFFRTAPREDLQGVGLAMQAKRLGLKRVYALHQRETDWKIDHADPFRRAARRLGLDVVGAGAFDGTGEDADEVARRVVSSGAEAVLVAGTIEEGGIPMLKALRERGGASLRVMLADTFAPVVPDLVKELGPGARGIYISSTDAPAGALDLSPSGLRFARDFGALKTPVGFTLPAAQATEVVLAAIARSDGTRASVLEELRKTRVKDGILGTFRFDRNGDITPATIPIFRVTGDSTPGTELYPNLNGVEVERILTIPARLSG